MPAASCIRADLPEPLRPRRPRRSAGSTCRPAPASSGVPPKLRKILSSFRIGGAIGSGSCQVIGAGKDDRLAAFKREGDGPLGNIGEGARGPEGQGESGKRITCIEDIEAFETGEADNRKQ